MGKGKQFGYLCCYKSNFDHLKKEVEKLRERRESVQHRIDFAKGNGEEIEQSVENWLISVDKIVEEAGKFVEDDEEAKNHCFKGLCPNLKNRHRLSKKAAREVKAIVELQDEGNFDRVSVRGISRARLVTYTESCSEGHEFIESRKSILNDILDALRGPYVNMIGVYGMAGIGKTTLVKEVARLAEEGRIFDKVVFAEVSQTADVKRIQGEIADQLGLNFCEESESERVMMLCDRLNKEKKILVILDDFWTSLDLERTGIPFGDVHRGCKILVTSRRRDALVSEMHCQNNYCVSVLNKEEAWSLFSKVVGDCVEDHDLQTVAIQVVNECGGLPIAILMVARTLRNKPLFAWKKALQELRFSGRNFTGLDALVGSTIELIYNYLEGEELKLTFLLCSLMEHPCDAPIMDLLKYGTGLGLFEYTYTMQKRRDRVYALVRKLKDSCLLLDDDTADCFSMLGIVRNAAISIASRNHHVFTVRNDTLIEWLNKDMLKNCIAIFLHDINTGKLPEGLEYPHLTSFCMSPKDPFLHIPDNFFAAMPKLRVLVLTRMKLLTLPSSFCHLPNLESLCLDQCILGDIAIIGNLKKLQILSLHCSCIEQLPREIGELSQLKLLDLSNCSKLKVIPPNVISNLSQLEELYLGNTSVEWEFEEPNRQRNNASLQELKILSHLTTLEIHIQAAVILPKGLFSRKLVRYKILIGDVWDWPGKSENTRTLKLKLPTNIYLDEILMKLKGIEVLFLDEVPGIENVLYELDRKGFPALKHLHAQNNPFILCIVDSTARVRCNAFPLLESMFLHNLIHLEKICHGLLTAESFCKLRIIKVRNCDKLKNIFSFSIARGLPQLQILKVIKCNNMETIFSVGREDDIGYNEVDKIEFGQLRSLILKFLPRLTSFYSQLKSSDELDTPMPLFNEKVVFPNLEILELYEINTERIWHNQPVAASPCIRNLTCLIVHGSEKLKYLFPSSIVRNFVQLQHLEICHCTVLEEIVSKERGAEATATFVFPKVTYLKLWNLSELITFYPGIHTSEWPLLKKLEVYGCNKVKIFTSEYLSFPETSEEIQFNIPTQQALFLVEKVSSHLEELKLSGKDITMICQGRLPTHLFQNLKILDVVNDKSDNFPICFLQCFKNLEKLELRWSSYKQIFSYKDAEKHAGKLTQIKSLKLWELSDLMYLWKKDFKLDSFVENLEMLEVWWCNSLVNLVPSSASFGNLVTLEVWYCKGLKNLVTSSTAKSLVQLMKLRIDGCKMITEIIANEGDVVENEIVFSKLKWLSLENLESLTSFHAGNYTFKFPYLEDLFVIDCPNMKIFSTRDLNAPKLQKVRQNWGLDKGCWEGDLNATIQQLHKKKSPSPLLSINSPSFPLDEATNTETLPSNLSGSHKSQPQLPLLMASPTFSLAAAARADELSSNLSGSHKTQSLLRESSLPLNASPLLPPPAAATVNKLSSNLSCSYKTQQNLAAVRGGGRDLSTAIFSRPSIKKAKDLAFLHQQVQIFSKSELVKATQNYDKSHFLGEGGYGSVYKGVLPDYTQVAVKKPKVTDKIWINQVFQNEMRIVSQINHKNVIKILGVCLQTKVPQLVYEFVSNGTLSHHIRGKSSHVLSTWKPCLTIASEIASALYYLHSLASPPIIHGNVKSTNILLDDNYTAKLAGFGLSVLISADETGMDMEVIQGTYGYLDPEYAMTGYLSMKSDVYSFGVVLMELLTGLKPGYMALASSEHNSSVGHFLDSIENNSLHQILNFQVADESEMEEIEIVADLAVKCLSSIGTKRPTMKLVSEELDRVKWSQENLWAQPDIEETVHSLGESSRF